MQGFNRWWLKIEQFTIEEDRREEEEEAKSTRKTQTRFRYATNNDHPAPRLYPPRLLTTDNVYYVNFLKHCEKHSFFNGYRWFVMDTN